jgi:hypothetical protein
METTQAKNGITQAKATKAVEEKVENAEIALRERVEQARDLVEDLRDRAEMAFHERPYLLPVATGALGLGVGVLIGSKLSRLILFTAAGALLSDSVRGQVAKISRDFIKDLGDKLETGDGEDVEDTDEVPSRA